MAMIISKPPRTVECDISFLPAYSYGSGITCGKKKCEEVAEKVELKATSQRKIIHLYLIESGIKVPIFADISNIGAAVTKPKNSFHSVYYYGDTQSISVSFNDVDADINLLSQSEKISLSKSDGINAFFYEARNSKKHPQEPLFEAIIPTTRGDKNRFIMYATKGISEEEFKTLLSKLELDKN